MWKRLACALSASVFCLGAAVRPVPLPADAGWFLQGGAITGGFVSRPAQADWPLWMQALVGGRKGVAAAELRRSDLRKVPDLFLVQAIRILEEARIFEPGLLRQATAIGYTARAAEWQEAKTSYQLAWIEAEGLPVADPATCSRLLTQLAYRDAFGPLRAALDRAQLPAGFRASVLRLLALREGQARATEAWALDPALPAAERLVVLTSLKAPADPRGLVASFRGTEQQDRAVYHAVNSGWIALNDPLVDEVLTLRKVPDERALWFMVRPEERVSDLLWMRAMDALHADRRAEAVRLAKVLLAVYPDSFYTGHAAYLLAGVEPAAPLPPEPALRVPADVTVFNAARLRPLLPPEAGPWPQPWQGLAARRRFDLILAQADPGKDEDTFLRAAQAAGQQDLVTRYLAVEQRCAIRTLRSLYPVRLAALAERLIREEGLEGQVDAAFVLAMIKNESVFQPQARSGAEAFGIMQLLRPTFRRMAGKRADILDPETNLRAGLRYYRTVIRSARLEALPLEVRLLYVLAGYHAGEGRARRWRDALEDGLAGRTGPVETMLRIDGIPIASTRAYVLHVLGDRELFLGLLGRPS